MKGPSLLVDLVADTQSTTIRLRERCVQTSHVLTAGKMHRLHPHQCTWTCIVACNSHAASCPLIPLLCVHQSDALFRALQLIYMGVSIAASAWVMRWLISAIDPEKENKKRVSPITIFCDSGCMRECRGHSAQLASKSQKIQFCLISTGHRCTMSVQAQPPLAVVQA